MHTNTDLRLSAGDHVVKFSEDDNELVAVVVGYLFAALEDRGKAIVIAAPYHSAALLSGLAVRGIDVEAAQTEGHLVVFDATETLSRFVTELTSNAVTHARSGFTVSLAEADGVVRIEVGDTDATLPELRSEDHTGQNGRGLLLVARLASEWGREVVPGGKVVWADLAG